MFVKIDERGSANGKEDSVAIRQEYEGDREWMKKIKITWWHQFFNELEWITLVHVHPWLSESDLRLHL